MATYESILTGQKNCQRSGTNTWAFGCCVQELQLKTFVEVLVPLEIRGRQIVLKQFRDIVGKILNYPLQLQ